MQDGSSVNIGRRKIVPAEFITFQQRQSVFPNTTTLNKKSHVTETPQPELKYIKYNRVVAEKHPRLT
jgi:hypothetical protein